MRPRRFVLASASPRRAEIFRQLGFAYEIIRTDVDESHDGYETPAQHVRRLARLKARAAWQRHRVPAAIYVGADTVVAIGDRILGKPRTKLEAERMLRALSGRTHSVLTGVAVLDERTARILSAVDTTHVHFRRLEKAEILRYVRSGEPMDKAGAYAIQGGAGIFVDRIEGDYLNVVGFPAARFLELLRRLASGTRRYHAPHLSGVRSVPDTRRP